MSTPSPTSQRPLSANSVRRILDSLEDLTQGNAKMARAICDLLDDDGKTTIDAVLATITSDDPREYLRKFKTRFNQDAGGALTVVFDGRRGPELYFTGSDPITEDIAEYSEQQTRRFSTNKQTIDAYAVEEKDPRSTIRYEQPDNLYIYISLDPRDGELAITCADLLERTIKAGLRDRYRAVFFRTDSVPVGEITDQHLDERIDESDLVIVLISNRYLNEETEAGRVSAAHPRPIIVTLENIVPSASVEPLNRLDIVSGSSFDKAQAAGHEAEQDFADHILDVINSRLTRAQEPSPRAREHLSVEAIEALLRCGDRAPDTKVVPTRAVVGVFEELRRDDAPLNVNRAADTPHAVERLASWARGLEGEHSSLCALLGNLGTGKTTSTVLLTRRLLELRKAGEQAPLPIYFDLRDLSPTTLKDFGLRTLLTQLLTNSSLSTITVDDVLATVQDEHTLVIFDGLDEVLVHLTPGDGQRLTRSLLEVLDLDDRGSQEENPRTRLLLSCRTQYFRTVEEEFSFFDGQGRENKRGKDYLVLTLLPFNEDQIREYLRRNVPEADTDRLMETIRSVHNLRELASQPVLLNMIREVLLTIDEDLSVGHRVRSVDLYERFVNKWLRRDDGKHSLIPEHKIQLMTHLAWQVWRSGSRTWSARWMETWMLQFLHTHPDMELHYSGRMPDQWKQDFRTATFLARRGDDFSFAHSSLLEYFLAKRLADSLEAESEDEARAAWDITRPSDEAFAFFAELIDRLPSPTQRQALASLERVGTHASASARANVFAYTRRALDKGAPHPRTDALNLADTDLRGWTIGSEKTPLNLTGVSLRGARLDDARIRRARLDGIDATAASMRRTLFEHCTLTQANLEEADLAGTVFRHCDLDGASLDKATRYRTQLLHTKGYRRELPDILTAPLTEDTPLRVLPEAQILGGHSGYVTAVAWSPDGHHILTASNDGTARIWDATTGDNTLTLTHTNSLSVVAWSPDGHHILTGSEDGTVRIWDATTGDNTLTLTRTGPVSAVALSPDGHHILTASRDRIARIWDATTGDNTLTLTHKASVTAVAWSPDARHILTGSDDGTARIWDTTTGDNTLTLTRAHKERITAVAWSPDSHHILTASNDGTARIWDTTTGDNTLTLTHTDPVSAVALSPDGHHILTASRDRIARIWDATTGDNTLTLTHKASVTAVAWSPDGHHILTASNDGTARIWDVTTGDNTLTLTLTHTDPVIAVAWSPDGHHILTGSVDRTACIWDATTGDNTLTLTLTHTDPVIAVAWSPDGHHILTGSVDRTACIWDATTGDNTLTLTDTHATSVTAVAWSPDGHHILTASRDRIARIWDATTGDNTLTLTHKASVTAVAWSPDGHHILTASNDGTARIWDATTGDNTLTLTLTHTSWVTAMAWSPNGHHILTASNDGTARIWDATTGDNTLTLTHTSWVRAVAWSPDGHHILTASRDRIARIWDATTGDNTLTLTHTSWVRAVAWSPDGHHILTASEDRTARIWDATKGEQVRFFIAFLPEGECAVLTPDQTRVIGASPYAWRWLGRYAKHPGGVLERIPVEIDGPLPPLGPGAMIE